MSIKKNAVAKFRYAARNLRAGGLFAALRQYARGDVLDVGGRDFYLTAKTQQVPFKSWTTLEPNADHQLAIEDPNFKSVSGDGCRMEFAANTFDTVLNVQVLEHVFEPIKMVHEITRVLRPKGYAIIFLPQGSVPHELPYNYYNFTRPWIEKAMQDAGLEIIKIEPDGGLWSTLASFYLHFFLQVFRAKGFSGPEYRRNAAFYLLVPFMAVFSLISLPICLFFSLGDMTEVTNNYLVVARKPG